MFQQWKLETDMKGVNFIDSVQTDGIQENSCSRLLGNYGYDNNENEQILCAPKNNWEIGKNVSFFCRRTLWLGLRDK